MRRDPGKGLLRSCIPPHALAVYPRLADIAFISQGHQHEQLFLKVVARCREPVSHGRRGTGVEELWREILILGVFCIVLLGLAVMRIHKRLD